MVSQARLAQQFRHGATNGRASSVEIRPLAGGHAIVDTRGMGAVLAFRMPSGRVIAFEGWYGHSMSTSCMLTKMGLSPVCRKDEDRRYLADAYSTGKPTVGTIEHHLDAGYQFVERDGKFR